MSKKSLFLTILLTMVFGLSSITISWADYTQCIVLRRPDSTLWVSRVNNGVPGSFFNISGLFGTQPTVVWDNDTSRYYLYGTSGTTGRVWRRTLDWNCNPVGGWLALTGPGWSFNPVGVAGGGRHLNFVSHQNVSMTGTLLSTSRRNLQAINIDLVDDGFILCRGTGTIEHNRSSSSGNVFARVFISTAYAGTAPAWTFTDLPSGSETGYTSFPYAVERWLSHSGFSGTRNVYLTAEEGGSAAFTTTTRAKNNTMTVEYYPYSY